MESFEFYRDTVAKARKISSMDGSGNGAVQSADFRNV
jgi:hypothetical protein